MAMLDQGVGGVTLMETLGVGRDVVGVTCQGGRVWHDVPFEPEARVSGFV